MSKKVRRLFEQFEPRHYILDLKPDKQAMTFNGSVIISGKKTGRPSRRLTFHQKGLKILVAHVTRHTKNGDQKVDVARVNSQNKYDEVRLHTHELLYPSSYTVRLEFSGKITKNMSGVYPCFFEYEGRDESLIATQFESHHAREVFPCIDEPQAKATFDLVLTTPIGETVLANTPAKKQTKKGNLQETVFETTPHMSTYLLAFVFGKLKHMEARTKSGTVVRTYATPDNAKLTDFALGVAVKCLEFYEEYFGINYPLAKCDMVALPDFASGAMENWGLITYREQALLVDPLHSTLANKQYVAMVVAHELAHQWFGNLVTMRWWTDLWLNEGFASWIEYLAVDHIFPKWEMWTQFIIDERQQALKLDALEHTHPVEVSVNHPDEIRTIFDTISYSKGSSIIHMLQQFLGPEDFQTGLKHYLTKHAYDNTDTVDLWTALEEASDKPVKQFMHAWTTNSGFPLVQATISDNTVQLKQQRFILNPKHSFKSQVLWPVALAANEDGLDVLFDKQEAVIKPKKTDGLKLNFGESGFFRTTYNASHLERLGELTRRGHFEPLDRLGILSDSLEAAKSGKASTTDALEFLINFGDEENYAVWDIIASSLGSIKLIFDDEELRTDMKPFVLKLVAKELKRIGWTRKKNESHFDQLLRPIVLGLAAAADEPNVVKKCQQLFESITDSEDLNPGLAIDIDPDLRGTVFGTVARLGGQKEYDKLLNLYNKSKLSEQRTILTAALTGFKQPAIIKQALGLINSPSVRLQDVGYWIPYSFLNRHARLATWEWLKQNWGWLEENLGSDLSFSRMPLYAARVFSDPGFTHEYRTFFEPRLNPSLDRSYKQGLEILEWQCDWKKRDLKEVKNFFKQKGHQ
ncbi:MAG TPA: M1 family metallopeptidase [Patescibacteria group bacterium]|nr:M1 family metallopeptidase [Patescibacteria group bacterium]